MRYDPKGKSMAFVIIDVQRKYRMNHLDEDLEQEFRISRINEISRMFRESDKPVIFVKYTGEGSLHRVYKGDDGDEFFEGIEVADSDIVMEKHHMNAFRDTDLAELLRSKGCDSILLAGTVTEYCVLSTYFGAYDNDFSPFMASSATISSDDDNNRAVEQITKVLTPNDIRNYLDGKPMVKDIPLHPDCQ